MNFLDVLRAILALAVVIGLIGLVGVGARRYAPGLLARLQSRAGEKKRLAVVETLVLGPTQRLLLVRVDGAERRILLGEGRDVSPSMPAGADQ